ncbi:DUF4336 domain-containing protein [Streptococcus dentiloxodontae]
MKIPLKLYYPLNTLKPVAENIWIADGDIVEMSAGIAKIPFSTRMTVVRLSDGRLWCHSPIKPYAELFQALDQLGEISYLIGPNKIHYAYIEAWTRRYPEAEVWLAPGIAERAQSQKIPLPAGQELADQVPVAWSSDLEQHLFKGSRFMKEAVFFHKPSQTLILTDMIENIETKQMKAHQRLLYKIGNNAYPNGRTPRDLRLTFAGHKKEAQTSLQVLKNWAPKNIILAHGRCHFSNGQEALEKAFEWVK